MRCGNIYFGDTGIMLNHLQCAVPEQSLECEEIATTAQIGNGEGMSKPMRVAFEIRFFAQVGE